jgi:hypothetical protein
MTRRASPERDRLGWHISESRLPPGSEILFREPTAQEQSLVMALNGDDAVEAKFAIDCRVVSSSFANSSCVQPLQ